MNTYFRLLSFAKPISKFAIPYIICAVLGVVFNTLNLALLAPLLLTLFNSNAADAPLLSKPGGWSDVLGMFNYYAQQAGQIYGPYTALKFVCAIIIVSVILGNIFRYLSQRIMENLRIHTLLNLRKTVFDNVMNMHVGFFNNQRKGDIISKIASDVQVVQFSVTNTLQIIFKEPVQLLAYVFLLFATSVKLTVFALLVIPISAFLISKIVKKLKQQATQSQESFGLMISYLDEALSGIKIIKAFNATDAIINKFDTENKHYSELIRKMAKRQQLSSPVSETLGVAMVTAIVLYGGSLILDNQSDLSVSEFIAYIALFSQVIRPAKAMTDSFSTIHAGLAAGERVLELIDEKPSINDAQLATEIKDFNQDIVFENVSFAYDDKVILSKINLTIPKGKTVALVGSSGGGKSTLMDLIPRFIDPKEGSILIDNFDLRQLKMNSLRNLIGMVNQESTLFNDSIYNNIAFGTPNATHEEIVNAAKIANAHAFILNTELGYETNIGDRGTKLSGGQKQRICIARAVLKNPPIMLLDEATSALDTESEKLVQDALTKLMKNRTSLVIAHRLSTIQNADLILVLEAGEIVQRGTHMELMNRDGQYRRLNEMQQLNEVN